MSYKTSKKIEKPIFVFGCCNSGTAITGHAIQSHKDVSGPKDEGPLTSGWPIEMTHYLCPHTFRMWAHPLFQRGDEKKPGDNLPYYMDKGSLDLRQRILDFYERSVPEDKRICDHSPQFTLRAEALQDMFPDAYHVVLVRNGIAVSEGIRRKRQYDPDRPRMSGFPTSIEDAALQWSESSRIISSYTERIKNVYIAKYEDLINNSKDELGKIFSFCNLDASNYEFPVFRPGDNEKQIARLTPKEIAVIIEIAGQMLRHFGYV